MDVTNRTPTAATPQRVFRLAYVVSHPIQYQVGLLRLIAAQPDIELLVLFSSDFSVRSYHDAGFGAAVAWDTPLLEGYRYVVLPRFRDTSDPGPTRPIARGFFRHLYRGLDGHPFDAMWVHGYSTVDTLHAMLAAKALGIPVLVRSDSWLADRPRSPWTLLAKQAFFRFLSSLVQGVLVSGTRNAEYWSFYFGKDKPLFLLPYAVDNESFAERAAAATAQRAALAAAFDLQPGRPIILFASKLQERKLCRDLLEAFLQLSRQQSEPYLLIVGDGEMRQALEQRVSSSGSDAVRFAGFRNQSELPRFFDLSTVFVLPARHEPWGLVVNEAMAAGLPVIVTDDCGCAIDLVHTGDNGFVYPAGDVAALRSALESVLQPGRAERMGQRSREIVSRWSFSEDVNALRTALRTVSGDVVQRPAEDAG